MNAFLRSCFPFSLPISWIAAFCLVIGVCEGAWFLERHFGADGHISLRSRDMAALLALVGAGLARAWYTHLLFQVDYACWLVLTPWTPAKPLPLGPMHLTPQDALVMAVPLLLHDRILPWPLFPLAFLAPYLVLHAWAFYASGMRAHALAIVFGLGLTLRLHFWPEWSLAVGALCYAVVAIGIHEWLTQFGNAFWPYSTKLPRAVSTGWPFAELSGALEDPVRREFGIWSHAPLGLLFGWLVYCVAASLTGELSWADAAKQMPRPEEQMFACVSAACLFSSLPAVIRLIFYVSDAQPPIDLLGRLITGRWIVPGFDVVLLAPLAIAILPPLAVGALIHFEGSIPLTVACHATIAAVLFLCAPPSWASWRLTGDYRLVANPVLLQSGGSQHREL